MDLMVIADLLITDYSGVFFDYLLTLKPILFFPYDLEKYTDSRDFFYDYHSLVPGPIVSTEEQLISKLGTIREWDQQYLEARIKARDKFNKYHDGKAILRIIKLLDLKLEKIKSFYINLIHLKIKYLSKNITILDQSTRM